MNQVNLLDLQVSVQDKNAFKSLEDYYAITMAFLHYLEHEQPTRIISPSHQNYIFYQYPDEYQHRITRPLNVDLFYEFTSSFHSSFERFMAFLDDLKLHQENIIHTSIGKSYLQTREASRVIYTVQQSIGCIGDSFRVANQARKRIGQLFETIVSLIIRKLGLVCEPRTITIPIPNFPGYKMSYELDFVFSRSKAILTSETKYIHSNEIVGSVKTTSKDRIDKVFLDKYLLSKLLGRDIRVVAIFLHDVQRAKRGNSIFGINSTFKTNHFLGYTVALNSLDGVYYIDPRPEMLANEKLHEQISDFERFLIHDLWTLSK